MRVIVSIQLRFLSCADPILKVHQLDMAIFVGTDVGLPGFHFHDTMLEVRNLSGMAVLLDTICQRFG